MPEPIKPPPMILTLEMERYPEKDRNVCRRGVVFDMFNIFKYWNIGNILESNFKIKMRPTQERTFTMSVSESKLQSLHNHSHTYRLNSPQVEYHYCMPSINLTFPC